MIDIIRIQNLRSIHESGDIKMKPIMILLGSNSSGKSTFLRSFPLFTQSVSKKLRGPIAWFDNAYVDFGDYKTALNKYANDNEGITFSYKLSSVAGRGYPFYRDSENVHNSVFKNITLSFTLKGDAKGTFVSNVKISCNKILYELSVNDRNDNIQCLINNMPLDIPEKLKFTYNTAFAILPLLIPNKSTEEGETLTSLLSKKLVGIFRKHCNKKLQNVRRLEALLSFGYLEKDKFLNHLKHGSDVKSFQKSIQNWTINTQEYNFIYNIFLLLKINTIIDIANAELAMFYHRCDYIAPMRAEAGRYYRIQGLQVQTVDPTGHNLLEFIASLTPREKMSYDNFLDGILGVTVDVPSESGMKSLRLKTSNGEFSIADVGYGYSQVLPVITKLWHTAFIAENVSNNYSSWKYRDLYKPTILMEQPELHLHPAMQAKVADTLVKTVEITRNASQRATLIVETHSQALINRIGRRIREGVLKSEDVNVLLFRKDDENKNSLIQQISFTEKGQLNDWPYGFFDPLD